MTLYSSESESELESTIKTQLIDAFNSTGTGSFASALTSVANDTGIVTNATLNQKLTVDQVENDLSFVVAAINPTSEPTSKPTSKPTTEPTKKPTTPTSTIKPTNSPTSEPTPPPTAPSKKIGKTNHNSAKVGLIVGLCIAFILVFVVFYAVQNRHRFTHCQRSEGEGFRSKTAGSTGGFGAFDEADTENPIVQASGDTADTRTRGLTQGMSGGRFRGQSTVQATDGL